MKYCFSFGKIYIIDLLLEARLEEYVVYDVFYVVVVEKRINLCFRLSL